MSHINRTLIWVVLREAVWFAPDAPGPTLAGTYVLLSTDEGMQLVRHRIAALVSDVDECRLSREVIAAGKELVPLRLGVRFAIATVVAVRS